MFRLDLCCVDDGYAFAKVDINGWAKSANFLTFKSDVEFKAVNVVVASYHILCNFSVNHECKIEIWLKSKNLKFSETIYLKKIIHCLVPFILFA